MPRQEMLLAIESSEFLVHRTVDKLAAKAVRADPSLGSELLPTADKSKLSLAVSIVQ